MFTRGESPERGVALAFIVYDTSTAVVLAWAGAAGTADGWLLWPVVGLHAILAAALAVGRGLLPGTDRK
jgi:NADH:ubiquinone oxidoreductase subunit 3 (subunit A)